MSGRTSGSVVDRVSAALAEVTNTQDSSSAPSTRILSPPERDRFQKCTPPWLRSSPPEPFETVCQLRTTIALVCESCDQKRERLRVPGDPQRSDVQGIEP